MNIISYRKSVASRGNEYYQLQEVGCFKSEWILSVTGNRLRQERMNIISYRKSVASRKNEYYQLQEIGCVKREWILSVTGSRLLQERMNIISYRKSVASRADGYLAHQVLQNTLVYSWRAPCSKVLVIMRSPEICFILSNRYFIIIAWWLKSINAMLLMPVFLLSSSLSLGPAFDALAFKFLFNNFSSYTFILRASLCCLPTVSSSYTYLKSANCKARHFQVVSIVVLQPHC